MKLTDLLHEMVERDASDLHIKAGSPPGLRIHGELVPIGDIPLTAEQTSAFIEQLLTDERRKVYETTRELDFSTAIEGMARFRVNLFHQRGSRAAVMRMIPVEVPALEDLNMPEIVKKLAMKPRGLVLVTGPTGSGKSTTLAAMIDFINRTQHGHILTLEDPIEFMHKDKQCYVNQREIGSDSLSFSNALRGALREDPDIILVGEMRDLETIALAITAAETGHLVFGTLHTTSAIQTVDRVIDVFPHAAQQQVRTQLANTLQGVLSQTLLPKIGGGRCCAQEIMIGTDAVRNCIREGKTPQLLNMLQTGGQYGMHTLEAALEWNVLEKKVTPEDAVAKANSPLSLIQTLHRAGIKFAGAETPAPPPPPGPKPSTQALAERFAKATGVSASDQEAAETKKEPAKEPVTQSAGAGAGGRMDDFEAFRQNRKKR